MRSLIVTVAGTATRFNREISEKTLKCLYSIGGFRNTLLYQILDKARDFDEFVIVGGYLYSKLKEFVNENLSEFRDRIKLVFNPEFATFGSGYSLLLGLHNVSHNATEIVFVEGDLYFNREDFDHIKNSEFNVLTVNHELITARKAVVVYEKVNGGLQYIYDTSHSYLEIKEPFLAVYNSGQVWKFVDTDKLSNVMKSLSPEQTKGSNLEIIQGYFGNLCPSEYEIVEFSTWHNCNTVADYKAVHSIITK